MGSISTEYGNCPAPDNKLAVCFDFDGTIGDTEDPAMEVAFWEIAPYLANASAANLEDQTAEYKRNNAGKAFEFMMEACDKDREAAGLPGCEQVRKEQGEAEDVVAVVDKHRAEFGLPGIRESYSKYPTLLQQQKIETVEALGKVARPCPGVVDMLESLKSNNIPFCIATTSPKPRVPVSISAGGLDKYFPAPKVHSGESDFDPPRFKPAPDVYLRAAAHEGAHPQNCVSVEDSGSGVGSAANAGMGLIVGYVGASHISQEMKDGHAAMLLSGSRSKDGRGADIVISDMSDLLPLILRFRDERNTSWVRGFASSLKHKYYLK